MIRNHYFKLLNRLDNSWSNDSTIHLQLSQKLRFVILSEECKENSQFLSIREISNKCNVSISTVAKVINELISEGILSKSRGTSTVVAIGAKNIIHKSEMDKIYKNEVPSILYRVELLGSSKSEFIDNLNKLNK